MKFLIIGLLTSLSITGHLELLDWLKIDELIEHDIEEVMIGMNKKID